MNYDPPKTGCFPSLKVLCVSVVHYPYDPSFIDLFTCCPKLEDLTIQGILEITLWISTSLLQLKTLRIYLDLESSSYPEYHFFINAPKLENLDISDDY